MYSLYPVMYIPYCVIYIQYIEYFVMYVKCLVIYFQYFAMYFQYPIILSCIFDKSVTYILYLVMCIQNIVMCIRKCCDVCAMIVF